jgi:hypothetical protein
MAMTFSLKLVNKSPTPIGSFAIAFNKNWAVIGSQQPPQFPAAIDDGESFEIPFPLVFLAGSASPL